jgi:hypothetical protein
MRGGDPEKATIRLGDERDRFRMVGVSFKVLLNLVDLVWGELSANKLVPE